MDSDRTWSVYSDIPLLGPTLQVGLQETDTEMEINMTRLLEWTWHPHLGGSGLGPREEPGCDAVSPAASASNTGSSEAGVTRMALSGVGTKSKAFVYPH